MKFNEQKEEFKTAVETLLKNYSVSAIMNVHEFKHSELVELQGLLVEFEDQAIMVNEKTSKKRLQSIAIKSQKLIAEIETRLNLN